MIKLIGLRRVILLSLLSGLNLLVIVSYFFGIQPMVDDADRRLAAASAKTAELRTKTSNIRRDIASLKDNLPKYQALQDRGFFQDQDRFLIGRLLEDLRSRANLPTFYFDVGSIEDVPNEDAGKMNYRLIRSRIKVVNMGAVLDTDVYAFLEEVSRVFPEHTRIQSFEIRHVADVTADALKKISAGQPIKFIEAGIVFDWMTLVPRPAERPAAEFRGR